MTLVKIRVISYTKRLIYASHTPFWFFFFCLPFYYTTEKTHRNCCSLLIPILGESWTCTTRRCPPHALAWSEEHKSVSYRVCFYTATNSVKVWQAFKKTTLQRRIFQFFLIFCCICRQHIGMFNRKNNDFWLQCTNLTLSFS